MTVDINKLNPTGSTEFDLFQWEVRDDLPEQEFKYQIPKKVLNNIPHDMKLLVQKMIDTIKLYDDRSIVIDYKVRNLKKGDTGSAIYGYHLDCTNNIHSDFIPETHLLYSTVIGTKFVLNELDTTNFSTVKEVLDNSILQEYNATINSVHKYTSQVLHSCPVLTEDAQRVLIRVTAGFHERIKNGK